ncbi:MAG TPA: hypothetical protein VID93_08950 [Acidimicrobiales bacterium]
MTITLDVLPAAHGDALIVTYGRPGNTHRILIDGGPAGTYANGLRAYLEAMDPEDRRFELAIVSHVDTDHIDGALKLMRDDELGLAIADIWFNGWPQLEALAPKEEDRGGLQGEYLTELLTGRPWNTAFSGGPALGDLDHPVKLPGGAELTVLSPTTGKLAVLAKDWVGTVTKAGFKPGDGAAVAKRLSDGTRYAPPQTAAERSRGADDGERGGGSKLGTDQAPANGSSIAVLLTYEGKQLLLGADAHAGVLTAALTALAARAGTPTVEIDLFKLAHHGSAGNITRELLDLVTCSRFVVSTNGDHFNHPDAETIEVLGRPGAAPLPIVYFNYLSDTTKAWSDPATQQRVGISAVFGDGGRLSIEV